MTGPDLAAWRALQLASGLVLKRAHPPLHSALLYGQRRKAQNHRRAQTRRDILIPVKSGPERRERIRVACPRPEGMGKAGHLIFPSP